VGGPKETTAKIFSNKILLQADRRTSDDITERLFFAFLQADTVDQYQRRHYKMSSLCLQYLEILPDPLRVGGPKETTAKISYKQINYIKDDITKRPLFACRTWKFSLILSGWEDPRRRQQKYLPINSFFNQIE
jgi:hypothetical protein